MKQKISIFIMLIITFLLGTNDVEAAGPSSDGYVKVTVGSTETYLYGSGKTIGTVNGLNYNSLENTLLINGYDNTTDQTEISISKMGDFKINVKGMNKFLNTNSSGAISISDTITEIDGTGTLYFNSFGLITSSDTTIKNISIINMGYLEGTDNGIAIYSTSEDADLTLNNVNLNFKYYNSIGNSVGVGSSGNLYINNSNITGEALTPLYSELNLEINNSKINVFGVDDYKSSPLLSRGEMIIKGNSIINVKPIDNNDVITYFGLFSNKITIESGTLNISNSLAGIYGDEIKINNGTINTSTYIGIASETITTINNGTIKIIDCITGLKSGDNYGENGIININGGILDISCLDDSELQSFSDLVSSKGGFPQKFKSTFISPIDLLYGDNENTGIKINDSLKIFEGGQLYSVSSEVMYVSYIGTGEFDFNNPDPFSMVSYPNKLLIKDKNWKPTVENKNEITNPSTIDNVNISSILLVMSILGLGMICIKRKKLSL